MQTQVKWEQGALDSLYAAKRAIEQAIHYYETAKTWNIPLSKDSGPLFAALDYADTAYNELQDFCSIVNGPFDTAEREAELKEQTEQLEACKEDHEQKVAEYQEFLQWLADRK